MVYYFFYLTKTSCNTHVTRIMSWIILNRKAFLDTRKNLAVKWERYYMST